MWNVTGFFPGEYLKPNDVFPVLSTVIIDLILRIVTTHVCTRINSIIIHVNKTNYKVLKYFLRLYKKFIQQ
jgi:hypothetical protein